MKPNFATPLGWLFAMFLAGSSQAGPLGDSLEIVVLPDTDSAATETLKSANGVDWWLGFVDATLVAGPPAALESALAGHEILARHTGVDTRYLAFHGRGCDHDVLAFPERVLYDGGRWSLVQMPVPVTEMSADRSLRPFTPDIQVTWQVGARKGAVPDPRIQALVTEVDADRWFADVVTLAGYDRHSRHPDLAEARDWVIDQFSAMPGMSSVTSEAFLVQGQVTWNVVATLPGTLRPDDWIIVGAHYDSRRSSISSTSPTPGAEDNATGCAGVLEMARIITTRQPEPTLLFMCYSGEEQGLIGSTFNAAQLDVAGDLDKVELMLNMDMIGYSSDADLDVLLETGPGHQSLVPEFGDAAALYTSLRTISDFAACCSDHVPYLNRGVAAILTIENDWFQYPHYHEQTDIPQNISNAIDMGGGILRMNMAVLAERTGIAQAPPDLIYSDGLEALKRFLFGP